MRASDEAQTGMLRGFYNKHAGAQSSVVAHCRTLLQAVEEVPLPGDDRPFAVAEWGCSHGGNSIAPVVTLCQHLQQRLQQLPANNRSHCRPLQVCFTPLVTYARPIRLTELLHLHQCPGQ